MICRRGKTGSLLNRPRIALSIHGSVGVRARDFDEQLDQPRTKFGRIAYTSKSFVLLTPGLLRRPRTNWSQNRKVDSMPKESKSVKVGSSWPPPPIDGEASS
jgi:hypothetical protein